MNLIYLKIEMEEAQKELLKKEAKKALANDMLSSNLEGLNIDSKAIDYFLHLWADSKIEQLNLLLSREQITKEEYDEIYNFLESV